MDAGHNTLVRNVHIGLNESLGQIGRCVDKGALRFSIKGTGKNTSSSAGNGILIVEIGQDRILKEVAHIRIVVLLGPNMLITRIDNGIGWDQVLGLGCHLGLVYTESTGLDGLVFDLACKTKRHVILCATEVSIRVGIDNKSALIGRGRLCGIAFEKVFDKIIAGSKRFLR